jgi:hypothetical protein
MQEAARMFQGMSFWFSKPFIVIDLKGAGLNTEDRAKPLPGSHPLVPDALPAGCRTKLSPPLKKA